MRAAGDHRSPPSLRDMIPPEHLPPRRRSWPASRGSLRRILPHRVLGLTAAFTAAVGAAAEWPPDFAGFQAEISPAVVARLGASPRHYRQIEPSLYHLCADHAGAFADLTADERQSRVVRLAEFIDRMRAATEDRVVIGPARRIIGLLDPARGLDPKEITAIATGYGARAEVFKQNPASETIPQVADRFLAAVAESAAGREPTTVVVLGHGAPEEIQSYSIPCGRLAAALLPPPGTTTGPVDLGRLTIVCDDCYSADFLIRLGTVVETMCRERGLELVSLPVMIAGTNRDRVGHADFGEKFVPHFWKDVIELFYVRRPRPETVTLGDFFDKVDNMMYGYGRAPIVEGAAVVGYRLVDPALCQDPVFFVPLSIPEAAALRSILGLPDDAPLPRFLDIG
jgi:hypothetical protein